MNRKMVWVTVLIVSLFSSVLVTADSATAWEEISDESHIRFYICTGNSGLSDTAYFYVDAFEDEQSCSTVIAALIVPFSVVALGLLLNQKRKNHEALKD
ncbi:MAG: hypothetical protein ACQCN5_13805 [Candidatus Bathyarchaeia archaeon]